MKRVYFFLLGMFLLSVCAPNLKAQADQFNGIIEELTENIKTVSTTKLTFEQEIKIVLPGVISFINKEINQKGEITEFIYEFNLADIDPVMVREITEKEKMYVQLIVDKNQKLVTITKNGELDSYNKLVKIYAEDIDNARIIKEKIKELIPVAENIMENKFSLDSYEEKLIWLTENVKDVNINDESFQQKLTKDELYTGKVNLEVVETSEKSSKTRKFEFNLADINLNSLKFEVKGAVFSVVFETKGKRKLIKSYAEGELSNYGYKIKIIAYNIENARDLRYILDQTIPLAEEELKSSLPIISDLNEATTLLSRSIGNIVIGEITYDQIFLNDCITKLSIVKDDMKKKVDSRYEFNLSDINQNSLDYKVSGKKFVLTFQTVGDSKLIKVFENDEQQNYINDIEILCNDMENARLLLHVFKKTIPLCESNIARLVPEQNIGNKIDWLIENTTEVSVGETVYSQLLERISEDNNKLRLTLKEITVKKNTEYIYEFNLSDINPNSLEYDISGKKLSVNLVTNYNTKVIKIYKDGEIQSYASQMNIHVSDIESARNILLALKECVTENAE